MANKSTMNGMFPATVVKEIFSLVNGHSTIIKLAKQMPVAFSGNDIFTFNLDGEVSIVGEGGQKPAGSAVLAPVSVKPIKVIYQHRLSDEFLRASEEKALAVALKNGADAALAIIDKGVPEAANKFNGSHP